MRQSEFAVDGSHMARRFVIRIELTEIAKDQLSDLSEKNGMTQVSIMSRMVTWFAAQPELIQAAVLGRYPKEIEQDCAKLILQRMAGEP
jgi:hypothetical protein